MTNDELNRAAHEAMGKCYGYEPPDVWNLPIAKRMCTKCGEHLASHEPVAYFTASLDTAAELERFTIEKVGDYKYVDALYGVVNGDGRVRDVTPLRRMTITATAEQRVRACLKALGKEI